MAEFPPRTRITPLQAFSTYATRRSHTYYCALATVQFTFLRSGAPQHTNRIAFRRPTWRRCVVFYFGWLSFLFVSRLSVALVLFSPAEHLFSFQKPSGNSSQKAFFKNPGNGLFQWARTTWESGKRHFSVPVSIQEEDDQLPTPQ